MKNLIILATLVAMVLGFVACEKTATETVSVTILSPTENSTVDSGQNLHVHVKFTDPTELHMYSLVLTNETDTTTLLNLSGHSHGKLFTIDTTFVVNVTAHSNFELEAIATNHSGETATKHAHFHVHP